MPQGDTGALVGLIANHNQVIPYTGAKLPCLSPTSGCGRHPELHAPRPKQPAASGVDFAIEKSHHLGRGRTCTRRWELSGYHQLRLGVGGGFRELARYRDRAHVLERMLSGRSWEFNRIKSDLPDVDLTVCAN